MRRFPPELNSDSVSLSASVSDSIVAISIELGEEFDFGPMGFLFDPFLGCDKKDEKSENPFFPFPSPIFPPFFACKAVPCR